MMRFLQDQLACAQEKQAKFANKNYQLHPEYQIKDKVYVDMRHFAFEKLLKKVIRIEKCQTLGNH